MADLSLLHRMQTQFPSELRQMVYTQLDFGVAIHLAKCNRFYRREVQPDCCTQDSKHAFLARAERYRRHATKPPFSHFHTSYACHDCNRVRPRDAFSDTSLAEDGVIGACTAFGSLHSGDAAYVEGPLLPGSTWSRARVGAKTYMQDPELSIWYRRNRRACFDCEVKRGGWSPGQAVPFRGQIHFYCVQCQLLKPGPSCLQCHSCKPCMEASLASKSAAECTDAIIDTHDPNFAHLVSSKSCLHVYVAWTRQPDTNNARTLEQFRRGLVSVVADERSGDPSRFMDLVFDPALDEMPPYSEHPEPERDMESMRDIGNSITAMGNEPEFGSGKARQPPWAGQHASEGPPSRRWSAST